jgi:hypothetical protein
MGVNDKLNGNPGRYRVTPIALTDGDGSAIAVDRYGRVILSSDSGATPNTPAIASSATALAANTSRRSWSIQNVGTNPLFILLGTGASTTVFHYVIKGGTGSSDGLGGSVSQSYPAVYQGIITVAGTSPSYVVMEM